MQAIQANGYRVHFNEDAYIALNEHIRNAAYSRIFVLSDANTNEYCLPLFLPNLETDLAIEIIEFEAGEAYKNIDSCVEVWNVLTELGADRKSLIINVGGGVVTDLGGFVAATFKRGLAFLNVPTTLLAMVDASIGGKNGVDLGPLKNQVGVIAVPELVLIDTQFLESLPQNEMRSGLAEMLKHGLIYDAAYWSQFLDLSKLDSGQLDGLIWESVRIKNEIVMQDPKETGLRKSLNFGHTIGHAIEGFLLERKDRKTILHGEAVAAGMIMESYISLKKGLLDADAYFQIRYVIKELYDDIDIAENDVPAIMSLLVHDKKNEYGKISFTLLNAIGECVVGQEADNQLIEDAFRAYKT